VIDFVDGNDVGVVPRGCRFRFLDEALLAGLVFQLLRPEHLDADEAVQPQVAGLVDNTHSALAQLGEYFVVGNCLADQQAPLARE
jgi:hypothetical protein